jgi:TolA-binding protein
MAAPEAPSRIGPYEIREPLARDGASAVYRAERSSDGQAVAIKLLPAEVSRNAEAVAKFHREAEAVARLSHPNVMQILDHGEDQGILYLVTEYVEGSTLDVLLRQRRLPLQQVLQVVKQVGRALEKAHGAGIVHRDLNPRNILVSPTLSVVKVADFGVTRVESVARRLGSSTTKELTLGTLSYLAPEQAADASTVDHRADIYSLGVVFYEALTGRIPLGRFSLPSELNRELPSEIDPIVLKCLSTDPGKRFANVAQFLEQVEKLEEMMRFQLLDELKGLKRGTSRLLGPTSVLGKRGVVALFVLVALVLVALGAWMLLHPVEESPANEVPATATPAAPAAPVPAPASSATGEAPAAASVPGSATPAAPLEPVATTTKPVTTSAVPPPAAQPKPSAAKPATALAAPATTPADAAPKPGVDPAQADLEVARGKFDAKLYDQALTDARSLVAKYPASPLAIDGHYLIAKSLAGLQRTAEALGAYVEIQSRFKGDSRAAEAAFQQARLVRAADSKKTTDEAKRLFADCASNYPTSSWAARALSAKAEIEREQRATVRDAALGATVPAALTTYRDLTTRFPTEPDAEKAFWELGQLLEDEKRWDLAAAAYEELGKRFPRTRFEAWFQAAEIYERRLKDEAKAKSAYGQVPTTSPRYKEAQKKLGG